MIAIARRALRGPIVDRTGAWLARSERDANGEAVRQYRDDTISHVVGYASRRYGTAGLERSYNAELLGLSGSGAFGELMDKFGQEPDRRLGLQLSLDLRLQRAAVRGLGSDAGAVVMLDPTTGEILALASTPGVRRAGRRRPGHVERHVRGRCSTTPASRCCRGPRSGATSRAPCSRS